MTLLGMRLGNEKMPKRIQMTRQRPWRADHPDAVIVARPTDFGNPWAVGSPGRLRRAVEAG